MKVEDGEIPACHVDVLFWGDVQKKKVSTLPFLIIREVEHDRLQKNIFSSCFWTLDLLHCMHFIHLHTVDNAEILPMAMDNIESYM